jgi:osmotically-inducible protein OsmY
MKTTKLACIISGAMALAGLVGCKTENEHRYSELSNGRMIDDKHITERVKEELNDNPVYKFSDINIETYGGLVQLSGFASTDAEKQKAQDLAESVPGVQRVDNAIALKPQPMQPTGRSGTNANSRIHSQ